MVFTLRDKKDWPIITGVYKLTFSNSTSNKVYIGSSEIVSNNYYGIRSRWQFHINLLHKNKHYSKKLQNAYNKYGGQNLTFEVIDVCDGKDIISTETEYITLFDSYNNGYNSRPIAESNKGIPLPEESLNKMKMTKRKNREPYEMSVLTLYKETKNALGISRELGLSHSVVLKILEDYNILPKNGDYRRKSIYAYNLDGSFIGQWKDAKSCADGLGLKSICSVSHVASGRNITYGGYWFSYEKYSKVEAYKNLNNRIKEGREKMSNPEHQILKNIHQYDLNGHLVKVWDTSTDIKKYFGLKNLSPISAVITGRKKTYKGFIWRRPPTKNSTLVPDWPKMITISK